MSESSKPYVAGFASDVRKAPVRVAFLTRRKSPAVKVQDEQYLMTYPGVLFRVATAVEGFAIFLVTLALVWNAPLEGLADPMHTPNPAKAPWYFLGLQELLHYFPPVVAGVLIPGLVIFALIIIPYFNINVESEGMFLKNRQRRLQMVVASIALFCMILVVGWRLEHEFAWDALVPALVIGGCMIAAERQVAAGRRTGLAAKPLSFWIMTWFLIELIVLTAIGTFFRGPGWSWVLPWRL